MNLKQLPRALPIVAGIFATILIPAEPMTPSAWAKQNLFVPDGPRAGGRWDPGLTPYVAEIIDALGPDSPHNFAAVRKSQQTGVSIGGIALCGSYIAKAPCRIGYALPTIDLLHEFNREKLALTIAQTPALKKLVRPQSSRSADGSTVSNKRYPGGSLSLINGNSAADLKSRTLKVGVADEVDSWPDEVGDEGDPLNLFKGRFTAFHATGDWKLLAISTPQLLGSSRIDDLYKAGDQRLWHVECPHCRERIVLEFKHLKFDRRPPYNAHYVTQCCGVEIPHHEKSALVRSGKFIPTNAEGLYPSFHVDALMSLVTTWDKVAEAFWEARGDEKKERGFYNVWLGLPYEIRGDAPDHVRLFERRGGYEEGHIPARGLMLVAGADVQHTGIWYEFVAYAPNGESWTIRHGFLEGDTTDPERGAFEMLARIYESKFPDAFGGLRTLDGLAVDAGDGGRYNQALAWTRLRPLAYAIKGVPGWYKPALGTATEVGITLGGRKVPGAAMLWPVGTWPLKHSLYANLRKVEGSEGKEAFPPGYCHFHAGCDERYFRQMTSEYLGAAKVAGRTVRVWKETGPNHLLDCRIYAMALAEHLGLSRMTHEEWAILARARMPQTEADLFAPEPLKIQTAAAIALEPAAAGAQQQAEPRSSRWIAPAQNWMRRG